MLKSIISVSPSAAIKLLDIKKKYQAKYINFTIKSGGCSGFQYVLEPCHQEPKSEELYEKDNLKIKIHKEETFLLLGTEIDWEDDIMGQRFIFKNPNSNFQCGCGKSFN